jgi:hypothetical protein
LAFTLLFFAGYLRKHRANIYNHLFCKEFIFCNRFHGFTACQISRHQVQFPMETLLNPLARHKTLDSGHQLELSESIVAVQQLSCARLAVTLDL